MKKRYIQLPKIYISYSQCELWKNDREKYIKIYMDQRDELRLSNKGQDYGKVVATALENDVNTGDVLTDAAMLLLDKYDVRDKEIEVEMKTKQGWLKIIGRPDTLDSKTKNFSETKTGLRDYPWTQKKANNHPQLSFYAMIIYLKYGVVPKCRLDWIETEKSLEGIRPTGKVVSFPVEITLEGILRTMADVTRVALEIENVFASHVKDKRIEVW